MRIVGDHDDRLAHFLIEALQHAKHIARRLLVKITGRLIADQNGRVGDDRARDGNALLLATG